MASSINNHLKIKGKTETKCTSFRYRLNEVHTIESHTLRHIPITYTTPKALKSKSTNDQRDSCEGWCHTDFPLVSQQHGTLHRIEQYHIILIREMCWKAISSSDKRPAAQQKPEECRLRRRRLCHVKSLILNPLTCHTHSKGPLPGKREHFFGTRARDQDREEEVTGGARGTLGEKGVLGSHQYQPKEGPARGRPRQPSLLLAGTM